MQVKGLELIAYEPRAAKAHGLSTATSNIGGQTLGYCSQEVFGSPFPRPVDPFADERKGDIVKYNEDFMALLELCIVCAFPGAFGWISPLLLSKILVAVTGISEFGTPGYLWRAGERVYNLERSFNIRDGFSRKDDTLPKRFLTEPLKMQDQRRGRW